MSLKMSQPKTAFDLVGTSASSAAIQFSAAVCECPAATARWPI